MKAVLAIGTCVAVLAVPISGSHRASDALDAMRQALGGAAVLDTLQTWSSSGSRTLSGVGGFRKTMSSEQLAMLPDRFLEVRRDMDNSGPLTIDITYYNGFDGQTLLRRTDANIPFPPDPGPQTPAAIAQRRQEYLAKGRQEFQRLMLVLTGRLPFGGVMTATMAPPEAIDGQPADVIDVSAVDGFAARLYLHASSRLPLAISWQAPPPLALMTTSSATVTSRGRVLSQTEPGPVPLPGPPGADITWTMALSDFKTRDGVQWPHRLRIRAGDSVTEDNRISRYRINPKIDMRRFQMARQ